MGTCAYVCPLTGKYSFYIAVGHKKAGAKKT